MFDRSEFMRNHWASLSLEGQGLVEKSAVTTEKGL